jgi:hypothetical protein
MDRLSIELSPSRILKRGGGRGFPAAGPGDL